MITKNEKRKKEKKRMDIFASRKTSLTYFFPFLAVFAGAFAAAFFAGAFLVAM